ncbi:MAG: peroxiredoxin-like family protein [Planctomycetota bacterium]
MFRLVLTAPVLFASAAFAQETLKERIDARRAEFAAVAPQVMQDAFDRGVREVGTSGVMETALKVGDVAPGFSLPGPDGTAVSFGELLREGPVVLTWYRGGWCPYCVIQLKAYEEARDAIESAGGTVVAIAPETPDKVAVTAEKASLNFHVLSDVGNAVAADYGLVYTLPEVVQEQFQGRIDITAYNSDESQTLPLAATYVVGTDGKVAWAFVEDDYRVRAEPADILAAVKAAK